MSGDVDHTKALKTLNTLINGRGGIDGKIIDLAHKSHFLVDDLEGAFDFGRGQDVGTTGVRLVFQKNGIDATLWLMSQIYNDIRDLHEVITNARQVIDALQLGPPGAPAEHKESSR